MNATEIIARLIDSKAINGEEAIFLYNGMIPTTFEWLKQNPIK